MASGGNDSDPSDDDVEESRAADADESESSNKEESAADPRGGAAFGPILRAGFAQSLFPRFTEAQRLISQAQTRQASILRAFTPMSIAAKTLQAQQRSTLSGFVLPSSIFEQFRRSFGLYTKALEGLPRLVLPPNLREVSDDITAHEVYEFLEEEGIPLYLIPRATIGRRLIRAKDHASRRRVLNDRFLDIVDDCAALVARCTVPAVATEVHFIQDGIGALRTGHHASAQAIFTVTLDTLISRFYPNKDTRKKITNRKKGSQMPDEISDMSIRRAYVWLPVWNAHQEFWQHKGDRIPNDYSRHATVHGVSKAQFNKRNCAQSLMLASSLVGYADQLIRAR